MIQVYLRMDGSDLQAVQVHKFGAVDSIISADGPAVQCELHEGQVILNRMVGLPFKDHRAAGVWWSVITMSKSDACELVNWLFAVANWTVGEGSHTACEVIRQGEELTEGVFG